MWGSFSNFLALDFHGVFSGLADCEMGSRFVAFFSGVRERGLGKRCFVFVPRKSSVGLQILVGALRT